MVGGRMSSLGQRSLDVARDHLARRVREVPGRGIDPQVSAYLVSCRRGGTAGAGILDLTGVALGLRDDDTAWCAAFASHCMAVSMLCADTDDVERAPHGFRAAVHEIVSDSKARGFWRGPTDRPELGWLAIWTRGAGDPLRGGTGHVGRVSWIGGSTYATIDGNVNNSVVEVMHSMADLELRGWVEV